METRKQISALLLAGAMAFGMASPAVASSSKNQTIKVKGASQLPTIKVSASAGSIILNPFRMTYSGKQADFLSDKSAQVLSIPTVVTNLSTATLMGSVKFTPTLGGDTELVRTINAASEKPQVSLTAAVGNWTPANASSKKDLPNGTMTNPVEIVLEGETIEGDNVVVLPAAKDKTSANYMAIRFTGATGGSGWQKNSKVDIAVVLTLKATDSDAIPSSNPSGGSSTGTGTGTGGGTGTGTGTGGGTTTPDTSKTIANGTCGTTAEDVTWTLSEKGTLTISGSNQGRMTNFTQPSAVPWASYRSQIKSLVVEDGVTYIGAYAFSDCSNLSDVSLADSVTYIGNRAFKDCTKLTGGIVFPNALKEINQYAFTGCSGLTSITLPASLTKLDSMALEGCTNLAQINVAEGNTTYRTVDGVLFTDSAVLGGSVLAKYPPKKAGTTYALPDDCVQIWSLAFAYCDRLTSITIPDTVRNLGQSVFSGCTGLTSISMNSVTQLYERTFSGCTSLTSVTLPKVTTLSAYAFEYCDKLTSIEIPQVRTLDGATGVFQYCESLTSIEIPKNTKAVPELAFCGCTGLERVVFPYSVTTLSEAAFGNCTGLKEVYYAGSEEDWKAVTKTGDDNKTTFSNETIQYTYNYVG